MTRALRAICTTAWVCLYNQGLTKRIHEPHDWVHFNDLTPSRRSDGNHGWFGYYRNLASNVAQKAKTAAGFMRERCCNLLLLRNSFSYKGERCSDRRKDGSLYVWP